MTATIIDESVASGASASGIIDRTEVAGPHDYAFFLDGDSNSADVTVEFQLEPPNRSNWYHHVQSDEKNVDITDGEVYYPETRGAERIRVTVTNNGASATAVTVDVYHYTNI